MANREDPDTAQRVARVHELVCAARAALREGTTQDVLGARAALRVAAVELEKLDLFDVILGETA
jgi:hypothetical protein